MLWIEVAGELHTPAVFSQEVHLAGGRVWTPVQVSLDGLLRLVKSKGCAVSEQMS
jgi:hypothetical protein